MKILVIHETEYIQKVIFEYQIIPELWASWGHEVYVIDYPAVWRKDKKWFDLGSLRSQVIPNVKRACKRKGVTLIRPGIIKIPLLSRLSAFIGYFFLIPLVIRKYKIEKIFLYSVPTNGLQTIMAAKRYKVPIYFRLLDVLHQLVPHKILVFPTYLIERIVYPRMTKLSAITPKLTEYAIKLGGNLKTSSYLPTGSDSDLFHREQKDKLLMNKLGIKKTDMVLTFAGTLYNFSGLDKIIEYFGKNQEKFPNIKFLIMGHGEQEGKLKSLVKKFALENRVIMTGFVEYQDLGKYLNLSDICINPFERNKITDIIFPSKIYQYLACGKPVIASRLSGVLEIFEDQKGANNIYYFDSRNTAEFFGILKQVKMRKINDTQATLQDIARTILSELKQIS